MARRHGCILIDGQRWLHTIGKHGLLDDHFFNDAMHPSVRGHIALAQAILEGLHSSSLFGWPREVPLPIIDQALCAAHFGIDAKAWQKLCARAGMYDFAGMADRYDPSERMAKHQRFMDAAQQIADGASPESVGLPNIGLGGIDITPR